MRRRVLFLPFPFRLLHPLVSLAERLGAELAVTSENLLGLRGARSLDLAEDVGRLRVAIRSLDDLLESGVFEEWIPRPPAGPSRLLQFLRPSEVEILDYARRETDWQSVDRFQPLARGPVVGLAVLACVGLAAVLRVAVASAAQSCGKGAVACGIGAEPPQVSDGTLTPCRSVCAPGRARPLGGESPLRARQGESLAGRQGCPP